MWVSHVVWPLLASSLMASVTAKRDPSSTRRGKVFSLFNIVRFENDICTSSATLAGGSVRRNGVCYTTASCASRGGTPQGRCASGFGVCCVFIRTDATRSVSDNCTYIQNPNYPDSFPAGDTSATYTIVKCSPNICFIRLDFETFTLVGLTDSMELDTECPTDSMSVMTTSGQRIPQICGENAGHHMFINLGREDGGAATLQFDIDPAGANRMWDIKVTQYACGSRLTPPDGCLQFLTGLSGRITTFNFNAQSESHLPSQKYSVCIRQEDGYCCVEYQVCPDFPVEGTSLSTEATPKAAVDSNCGTRDYIAISQSSDTCIQSVNPVTHYKYCGGKLGIHPFPTNNPICDCTSPFIVDIVTDDLSDLGGAPNTVPSKGICLEWKQIPCTG